MQALRAQGRWLPLLCLTLLWSGLARAQDRPNVLLIILDDSNDWIGFLDEHPQTKTPRMDALAAEGIRFTSAHAAAALCNPSRTSFLTGISPGRSGVRINLDQPWRQFLPKAVSLNQAFRKAGYYTVGLGKIFHGNPGNSDLANWHEYTSHPASAAPPAAAIPINGFDEITRGGPGGGDWGVVNAPASAFEDHIVATWAEEFFANRNPADARPFFLAVGFRSTHSPWYFPRSYFDRIAGGDTSRIVLPSTMSGDLDDVGPVARQMADESVWAPLVENPAAVRWAIHSYLTGIRFMDEQVGRVLDALRNAGHANDTIVVLLSDHGYHLSEKQTWQKQLLWEEDTRVPMVFRIPSRFLPAPVAKVDQPVSISAIYPTLLELAGIPLPAYADDDPLYHIDYRSLVPLLQGNAPDWSEVAVTYGPQDELSMRLPDQRFTLYRNGFRELYERNSDPAEWYNVATAAQHAEQVQVLTSDAKRYLAGQHAPFGLRDSCGTPNLERDSQPGIYAWKDCSVATKQAWRIRVSGGDHGGTKRFSGHVSAGAGIINLTPVGLEQGDTLSQNLDYNIAVAKLDNEGFNFNVSNEADACLKFDVIPTGAALHIGGTRFHLPAPVNLRTLESCGAIGGITPVPVVDWDVTTGGVSSNSNLIRYTGSPTGWGQNLASSGPLADLSLGNSFEVRWKIEGNPAASIFTVGLGRQGTLGSWRDIEFGLRNTGGLLQVYESGAWSSNGPDLKNGDVVALRVRPGYLEYRHEENIVYSRAYNGTPAFYVNASFLSGAIAVRVTAQRVPP